MEKDFKNMIVLNYGYVYADTLEEELINSKNYLTKNKWFDYVVSDGVINSLKNILEKQPLDRLGLKKIIYDDVLNSKNIVFTSLNEDNAVSAASRLSEEILVLHFM